MIHIREKNSKLYWVKHFRVPFCKNKTIEIQLTDWDEIHYVFNFHTEWTCRCDHAGFAFYFDLLSFYFGFTIKDNRHWNYRKKRYYLDGEERLEIDNYQTLINTEKEGDITWI